MLTIGCSTDGRLVLRALWLTFESDGLRAYPFCPQMEYEEIRVDGKLGVSVAAEAQMMGSNMWRVELNSIVEAVQRQLQKLTPVYKGPFIGIVSAKQDEKCEYTIQQMTKDNFRSVRVPEIGRLRVHKEYVEDCRAVQVSYVRRLKRNVLGRIADNSVAFISHIRGRTVRRVISKRISTTSWKTRKF